MGWWLGRARDALGVVVATVLIPVKSFALAKHRLADALSPEERADLARELAITVVHAAAPNPVAVVCDDDGVADWAESVGAQVIRQRRTGLNNAIGDAVDDLAAMGIERVIIAHADLPLATDLGWVADADGVTIVPDRRNEGTNVMSVPTDAGFVFNYGEGSFALHRAEAERCALTLRVVRDTRLGLDLDHPADLDELDRRR